MQKKDMKNTLVTVIASQILLLLLTCGSASAASKPELQKVRHTVLSSTSEQVSLQLNGSYSPKVFTLKGETPRIIFDFPDMTYGREVPGNASTNGSIVKRIRVGRNTDETPRTRIVFDVATLQGVTYNQQFDDKTSILTVQFTTDAKPAAPGAKIKTAVPTAKNSSKAADTPNKTTEKKAPVAKTAQTPTAAPPDSQSITKTEAVPAASDAKTLPTAQEPSPKPAVTAEKAEEKKTQVPTAAQSAPETSAGTKSSTKTTPPESDAKALPVPQETSAKPAATTEKVEEKKMPTPATAPPQPAINADAKPVTKTETVKPAATTGGDVGPLLESVKFDGTSPKGEMVLFKLNDFHPPAIHGVEEGVPRVICDFNNTQMVDSVKNLIKTDGKSIKIIRVTKLKKPDRIRVVLDLEPNRSYDLQQVFFKEDNLFVIIVNAAKK